MSVTSSASRGWRGKEAVDDLQAFTAQVRKFSVRTFIVWILIVCRANLLCKSVYVFVLDGPSADCLWYDGDVMAVVVKLDEKMSDGSE